jgi:hypothetical protein
LRRLACVPIPHRHHYTRSTKFPRESSTKIRPHLPPIPSSIPVSKSAKIGGSRRNPAALAVPTPCGRISGLQGY